MPIGDFCTKRVVTAREDDSVVEAARLMKKENIGAVVVVDRKNVPVGMITDRDIAVKVIAEGKRPEATSLKDAMSGDVVVLSKERGIFETIKTMCDQGVRRVPVVDGEGQLFGIISLDDLLIVFGEEMASMAGAVAFGNAASRSRRFVAD